MKLRLATIGLLCVLYCQTVQPPEPTPLEKSIQTLLGQYRGPQNVSLAILPFRDEHGQESAAARMIYSALGTACFRDGRFRLLERDKIIQVLDEQSLAQSGLIDEQSAARLGRLIGARVLLLFDVKQNIVNMRITDVETAEIYSITDYSEGIINDPGRLLEQDNMVLLPAGNFIM
ncbi:MAG: hypothetical protein KDK27_03150 [Leptospiraceae bacterium]|nr:hypothetical protein [Leptospiraceae bacterium]